MNICSIETFPLLYRLSKPYGDANGMKAYRVSYVIRITTKSGIEGWGECTDWLPTLHKGFHDRIIPFLLGKSAFDRTRLTQTVHKWHARSSAAVSMALTEIVARRCGVSVCDLWGGKQREKVPVYASFQSYSDDVQWQEISITRVEQSVHQGFTSVKVKIGGKQISEDQQHIGKLQALLQGRVHLALDANQSYDAAAAMQWSKQTEEWSNLLWLEEPLNMKYRAEYALLRSRMPAPLAGGENIADAAGYMALLDKHSLDLITPDPQHVAGGIDGFRETLRLARHYGIRATPHTYDGALSRLYALFAQACLEPWSKMAPDQVEPVEWDVMENPFTSLLPIPLASGEVAIPDGVGIGLEIDKEKLEFYRWDGSSYQ